MRNIIGGPIAPPPIGFWLGGTNLATAPATTNAGPLGHKRGRGEHGPESGLPVSRHDNGLSIVLLGANGRHKSNPECEPLNASTRLGMGNGDRTGQQRYKFTCRINYSCAPWRRCLSHYFK
jgi:hypothetical protein